MKVFIALRNCVLLYGVVCLSALGCASIRDWITPDPKPVPPANTLPINPDVGPDLPNSISEHWSLARKEHDQTWRIRWPSYFARTLNLGSGSYCLANGNRAEFRSFDGDNGSKRPSYTMPLSIALVEPATCILYDASGKAAGWFKAERINASGRLPAAVEVERR